MRSRRGFFSGKNTPLEFWEHAISGYCHIWSVFIDFEVLGGSHWVLGIGYLQAFSGCVRSRRVFFLAKKHVPGFVRHVPSQKSVFLSVLGVWGWGGVGTLILTLGPPAVKGKNKNKTY